MNRRSFFGGLLTLMPGAAYAAERTCKRWTTKEQFAFYKPPTRNRVTITVRYTDEKPAIMQTKNCKGGAGCALERVSDGEWELAVPRPVDFSDEKALYILGHEVLHALGAQHG